MSMKRMFLVMLAVASLSSAASACSAPAEDEQDAPGDTGAPGDGAGGATAAAGAGVNPGGSAGGATATAGTSGGATAGSVATPPENPNGTPPPPPTTPPPVPEELDQSVDWTALKLIYPTAFTAFDGEHQFKVPFYVDGATVELSGWSAIPSDSVTFDADPDGGMGGVIVTVVKDVPEITIAARSDTIGGVALLKVTSATPAQWAAGEARYNNGKEFDLPMIDPAMFAELLLDPNWTPPAPPGDIACNNCHSLGAKLLEVQHTPTQAARFSDEQIRTILTMGTKPEGVGLRVLPDMLFGMTGTEVYKMFHTWDSTEEEIVGLIVYLRSLTPMGQGDILLPDGTYAAPGMLPTMP
jgi:hypothetical protein